MNSKQADMKCHIAPSTVFVHHKIIEPHLIKFSANIWLPKGAQLHQHCRPAASTSFKVRHHNLKRKGIKWSFPGCRQNLEQGSNQFHSGNQWLSMIINHITYDVCHGRCKQNVLAIVLHTVLEARHKNLHCDMFSQWELVSLQVVYASAQWTKSCMTSGGQLLDEQKVFSTWNLQIFSVTIRKFLCQQFSPFHMLALSSLRIPRCKSSFFQHWTRQCWPLTPVSQLSKSGVKNNWKQPSKSSFTCVSMVCIAVSTIAMCQM